MKSLTAEPKAKANKFGKVNRRLRKAQRLGKMAQSIFHSYYHTARHKRFNVVLAIAQENLRQQYAEQALYN